VAKTPKEQMGVDLPEGDEELTPDFVEPSRTTADEQAAVQQQMAAEAERPDWLPEQYKSPEAFAEAHRSLQERLRQESEERKDLQAQLEQLAEAVQQQQYQQPYEQPADVIDSVAAEISAAREVGDVRRELELQAWLQNYTLQQSVSANAADQAAAQEPTLAMQDELIAAHHAMTMQRTYPDWDEYAPKVRDLIQAEPWRLPDSALSDLASTQRALSDAYEVLKARDLLSEQEQLRERGLSQADVSRARKLEAQTMEGASGRPDEPSRVDRELAEMQMALRRNSGIAAIKQELRGRQHNRIPAG
jgi:hypothetical protein